MHMQQDQKRSCFLASRCFSLLFVSRSPSSAPLPVSLANYLYADVPVDTPLSRCKCCNPVAMFVTYFRNHPVELSFHYLRAPNRVLDSKVSRIESRRRVARGFKYIYVPFKCSFATSFFSPLSSKLCVPERGIIISSQE